MPEGIALRRGRLMSSRERRTKLETMVKPQTFEAVARVTEECGLSASRWLADRLDEWFERNRPDLIATD